MVGGEKRTVSEIEVAMDGGVWGRTHNGERFVVGRCGQRVDGGGRFGLWWWGSIGDSKDWQWVRVAAGEWIGDGEGFGLGGVGGERTGSK